MVSNKPETDLCRQYKRKNSNAIIKEQDYMLEVSKLIKKIIKYHQ